MGLIYMRTSPSGGKYIGQTILTEERRWKQHVWSAYYTGASDFNTYLSKAIRKYTPQQFTVTILEDNISNDKLNDREIYWIEYYHTFYKDKQHGYNLTRGGGGLRLYTGQEFLDYWNEGLAVIEISEITGIGQTTISKHLKNLGITTDEINLRGNYLQGLRKIHCNLQDLQILWNEGYIVKEIQKKLGYTGDSTVSNLLTKYLNIPKQEIVDRGNAHMSKTNSHICLQYLPSGELIHTWESVASAAKQLNYDPSSLAKVCRGVNQSAYGYIWRYQDNPYTPEQLIQRKKESGAKRRGKSVICIETNEIFPSISLCSDKLDITRSALTTALWRHGIYEKNNLHYKIKE